MPGSVPSPTHAIHAVGIRKSYGDQVVLDGIDLDVAAGTVFALLGPNGAGKTTLVQILSTLLPPDGGQACGRRPRRRRATPTGSAARDRPDRPVRRGRQPAHRRGEPPPHGRPAATSAGPTGRRRVAELLERFDLVDAADKPPTTYSGGMRRRLDLAMTLVGRPRIIFLDEPTTGLDPRSRHTMWQHRPRTSSPTASPSSSPRSTSTRPTSSPTASPCSTAAASSAEGSPAELKRLVPGGHIRLRFADPLDPGSRARPHRRPRGRPRRAHPRRRRRRRHPHPAGDAGTGSTTRPIDVDEPRHPHPDLDDVFFALTGRAERTSHPSHRPPNGGRARMTTTSSRTLDRLGHDAAPQPAPPAPLPERHGDAHRHARRVPAPLRLRLRRHARGRPRRRDRWTGRTTSTYVVPGILCIAVWPPSLRAPPSRSPWT